MYFNILDVSFALLQNTDICVLHHLCLTCKPL